MNAKGRLNFRRPFFFSAYGFLGNPLHVQGVLFYIPTHEVS